MRFVIVLLWTFLFHYNAIAQVINGIIKSDDDVPLQYATIQVLNTPATTISDSTGHYQLLLPKGFYKIKIGALGYATQIKDIEVTEAFLSINITLLRQTNSLDEVMITANKIEQNIIDVPISVTHLSAEKLNSTRTWRLEDLRALVPNYQYADLGVGYQQMQSIRGISVFSENPSVATYIDGVSALDVSANGLQLTDIERIEILRGPQGTLYGRSAMGGVINIITKQPTAKPSGYVEVSTGNQGLQRYALGFKMPIIKNKLFTGFSGQFQKQFGFYTNDLSDKISFDGVSLKGTPEDGERMGDEQSFYGNFFLKWLASEKLKITLNIKAQQDQSIGASMYYQAVENEVTAINKPFKMAVNDLGSNKRNLNNNSLALMYNHKKFLFTSVTAYQRILQFYNNIDQDLFPYDLATGASYNNEPGDAIPQNVWSQEFRFSSSPTAKKITWTAGTYFFHQQYLKRYATQYERLALFFGETPGLQVAQNDENNFGIAAFGQAAYKTKKRWEFTLGLRYDIEYRSSLIARFKVDSIGNKTYTTPEENRDKNFQALSPKAAVAYRFSEHNSIYISYSRGFRAGGINTVANTSTYETFKPEYSDNVEIGYKLLSNNGKYYLQSSLFYLYWTDLQLDFRTEEGIYLINNIGNVQAFGFEIEANAKPIKNFWLDASLGFNHSRYQNFEFLEENIKGNTTILAPPVTLFTAAQYQFDLSNKINLVLRGECRYMGNQYFDLINTIKQEGYFVFNARTSFQYKNASFSFWIQNIANKQYIAYALPGYFRYSILNRPRAIGITLSVTF